MTKEPQLPQRQVNRIFACIASGVLVALGGVTLAGWMFHIDVLKQIIPGALPMKPNMAAGFLLCGITLAIVSRNRTSKPMRICAMAISAGVGVLSAMTLGEYIFGWNFPIEDWLITGPAPEVVDVLHPGRLLFVTALGFLLCASALFTASTPVPKPFRFRIVVGLGASLLFIGVVPLVGFLFEITFGPRWNFMGMDISSVPPAIGFTLLGCGLLALLQSEGRLTWSLNRLTTAGFVIGLALMVTAAAAAFSFTKRMSEATTSIAHREELLTEVQKIMTSATKLASQERLYVIVGDEALLKERQRIEGNIKEDFLDVRKLTSGDPIQRGRLDAMEALVGKRIEWGQQVITVRREQGVGIASKMVAEGLGIKLTDEISGLLIAMQDDERRFLDDDRRQARVASSMAFSLLPSGIFLSLIILSLGVFSLNAGMTEQAQTQRALKQSEARYRDLFESNPNPMWVFDVQTFAFLAVNSAAINHYGYSRQEFLAMTIKEIRPTEDIADLIADLCAPDTDLNTRIQWQHRKKDGTLIDVEIASHEVIWVGQRAKLALITDITERKRTEERLREQADMLNRAQDAIIIRDFKDQRITFWNSGAERLYGWRADEVIDQLIGDVMYVDPKDREQPLKTLVSTGEFRGELKHVTKDGRELIVDGRATIVRNADGTPRSVLSINTNMTEQKKLETHLLRAQRLESIGTLASGVAHDLNNILTPILMCAQVLRSEISEEERQSALALIEESAQRGAGVVKQVLTFARGVEGERVLIKPSHLIEEMVDIARKTFPKSIEISGRYADDLWSIQGDPTQLHQVLLNLSVNARDAMPNGGSLVVSAENFTVDEHYASMTPEARPGQFISLRVSDTGFGMPRAMLDKIFDPFFTSKEVGKGTGLGLSTVLGIVKSHGGFISVYSDQGKGTTFKLFLPATITHEEFQKSKASVVPIQGSGELILVVDDEPNILGITKMILRKHHYDVLSAGDGPEALGIFATQMQSIRLVITDVSMPYMDGLALARALKKMKSDLPIIASTGQGEQAGLADFEALGVKNILAKPYNTQQLLATIHDTLQEKAEPAV